MIHNILGLFNKVQLKIVFATLYLYITKTNIGGS